MLKHPSLLFLAFLFTTSSNLWGQDQIVTHRADTIHGKIETVGLTEIFYLPKELVNGPNRSILCADVDKLIYEDGRVEHIGQESGRKTPGTKAIKIKPFSPVSSHLSFAYEQVLRPGLNLELEAGIIGVEFRPRFDSKNARGGLLKVALKLPFGTNYSSNRSLLKGGYFKPTLALSYFAQDFYHNYFVDNIGWQRDPIDARTLSGAALFTFGTQLIAVNRFTFDFYGGMGFYFNTTTLNPTSDEIEDYIFLPNRFFSHLVDPQTEPLAFHVGFAVGYILP